jgi:hypothetical protein
MKKYYGKCDTCQIPTPRKDSHRCRKCYGKSKRIPIKKRFFERIKKTPYCWNWVGYVNRLGYGELWNGRHDMAHRISWKIHHGEIPQGKFVCHLCDNPKCVNPKHLWIGDTKANTTDRTTKGRGVKGEQHPLHKLTTKEVKEIRNVDISKRGTMMKIAKQFNVSHTLIRNILKGKAWPHALPKRLW